ncbi:MAG: hypothetical protein Q4A66_00935 [Eubacteriales bacterium]|nr:hypothetical protein [Eubacteriales bacterium]
MQNLSGKEKRLLRRLQTEKGAMRGHMTALFRLPGRPEPDVERPKGLRERLCALRLRTNDPLTGVLSSHSAQMELLRAKRQEKWIPRTWAVGRKFREVQWKEMPESVVLRPDHLPGEKCLIDRSQKGWKKKAKHKFKKWMRRNAFAKTGYPEYAQTEPLVLVEESRPGRMLHVLCIGGEVRAMYWQEEPGCVMDAFGGVLCERSAKAPDPLSEIHSFCREVSADFPFMKLALIIGEGQPKCTGISLREEMEFFESIPAELDEELGSMLKLPNA